MVVGKGFQMIKRTENLYQLSESTHVFIFPEYEDLGNAGIVTTDEGVVVIDTDVRSVDRLFETIPQMTDKPVRHLINSHHAFDHTSGNCEFAKNGVTIIGSKACREELIHHGENNFQRWSNREPYIRDILKRKKTSVALPNITFDHELELHLGEETIQLFCYGHAHTPGDIIIFLPKHGILFGGDVLWCGFFPNIREANVPNQIQVIDRILQFRVRYYIPGHGHVSVDRNEIIELRDYLSALYESVGTMVGQGRTLEEIQLVEESLVKEHPNWRGRQYLTRGIEVVYRSMVPQERQFPSEQS